MRFDVGELGGGIQSHGMSSAKAEQLKDSKAAMLEFPGEWEWHRPPKGKGQKGGVGEGVGAVVGCVVPGGGG